MKKSKQAKKRTGKKRSLLMYQKLVKQWKKLSVKQKILLGLAAFVILSITAYFSYAWYQGYAFRKVEKKLDALTQEIVTELGEPLYQKKDQSCSYASAKFSKGRLGCGSQNTLVYGVNDQFAASQKVILMQSVAKNTSLFVDHVDNIDDFNKPSSNYVGWINYKDIPDASRCGASYYYYNDKLLGERSIFLNDKYDLYILTSLGCYTDPLRPLFPIKD